MHQMPTEQGATPKEGRRTTFIEDTQRTMVGNQHRHHQTVTKVKWDGRDSHHCQPIHKNDLVESNNNKHLIRRNSKDLLG